jgi:signal transduction histidine kinase
MAMTVRLPRNTVRLRLTGLYGSLFLGSGAALLAITYLLVRNTTGPLFFASIRIYGGIGMPGGAPSLPQLAAAARAQGAAWHGAELHQLLEYSAIALGVMVLASVALGWFVAGRVLRPLRTITTAVRDISASNLHDRLAITGPDDDLRELAETCNGLLDRLEAAFDAQRQFVANASHELRTPLARERTVMEVALRDPHATVESLRAAGQRVLASGQQQERLIEALLTLARSQRGLGHSEPVDLCAVTSRVLGAHAMEAGRRGLRVRPGPGPAVLLGDLRLAERLVENLVQNALRHNEPGGEVAVTTATEHGRAVLRVANTGPEIPPGEVGLLTEPFRRRAPDRTSPAGSALAGDPPRGLGLGLSIVQAIATAHQAGCTLSPRPGGGLVAEVSFPAFPAVRDPGRPRAQPVPAA